MSICIFWRSGSEKSVFIHGVEPSQNTVGENFTLRLSAPSMRQKTSRIWIFLKVKMLNIRRLMFGTWGSESPSLSAKQPEQFENQLFRLLFQRSLRQVCAKRYMSFHSAKKMKG